MFRARLRGTGKQAARCEECFRNGPEVSTKLAGGRRLGAASFPAPDEVTWRLPSGDSLTSACHNTRKEMIVRKGMDMRRILILSTCVWAAGADAAERYDLVRVGKAAATIVYGGQDHAAATRLSRRLEEWTGVSLPLVEATTTDPKVNTDVVVVIGSPRSNPVTKILLGADARIEQLGKEGLLVKTMKWRNKTAVALAGATRLGALFATGEFLHWHLHIDNEDAWVEATDVSATPALDKRLVWSSVGGCNWPPDHATLHAKQSPSGLGPAIRDESSYLAHTKRLTDFLTEHKYNGAIFWGFVGTTTGGVEPARQVSRYAKENGIRILPLIGTGIYGGFVHGAHEFNIPTWLKDHPDARCKRSDGTYGDGGAMTACHPESVKFYRDGAEWLFTTFPDIGGVNLENGDWVECWNDDCVAARADPENDPSFYWDMMASQRDIIEVGLKHNPDAWMTFATYTPFTERLIRRDLGNAMKKNLAQGVVYPPRFLNQVDPRSIAHWTVTGMDSTYHWPDDGGPPPGRLSHHIAFTHANSFYGPKTNPDRWWAEPNASFDEGSPLLFFHIPQAVKTSFEGYVIKGFVGDASPQNELFYLAFEELTWHPNSTPERFFETRLTKIYGGAERATAFLDMLRKTTKVPAKILADRVRAEREAHATEKDPRVSRRWLNLAGELRRRARLAEEMQEQEKAQP